MVTKSPADQYYCVIDLICVKRLFENETLSFSCFWLEGQSFCSVLFLYKIKITPEISWFVFLCENKVTENTSVVIWLPSKDFYQWRLDWTGAALWRHWTDFVYFNNHKQNNVYFWLPVCSAALLLSVAWRCLLLMDNSLFTWRIWNIPLFISSSNSSHLQSFFSLRRWLLHRRKKRMLPQTMVVAISMAPSRAAPVSKL